MLREEERSDYLRLPQAANSLLHVLENISDGFYILNRNWEIIFVSSKTQVLFQLNKEDLGKILWERFPDAVGSAFYHEYHRAFAENNIVSFEAYSPQAHIWCRVSAYPYNEHLFIYIQDITERIHQDKRLEFIAQATSEVIWEMSLGSDEFSMNGEKFNQLFGYHLEIRASYPVAVWKDKIHLDDLHKMEEIHSYALEQDYDFYINEYRFKKADGSWAYVKDRTYVVKDPSGRPVSLIGATEDISRERLAELALQESERSYRQLFQNSPFPTWVYHLNTYRFLDINQAALELYGYSREEFLNMTLFDIRPPDEYPRMVEGLAKINERSRSDVGTFTHLKKNGEELLAEVSLSAIHFKGNKAGMAMIRDVTEKVKLEQQLVQAQIKQQKKVTKAVIEAQEQQRDELAKELHDNVNQILTAAKLYVENIASLPDQNSRFVQKSSELIQKSINEIRSLTRQLSTPSIAALGLRSSLLELIVSYQELKPFSLNFTCEVEEKEIDNGLRLTLYRIVQELLNNAVKYAQASKVSIQILQDDSHLNLTYNDDGVGFDSAVVQCGQGMKNIKNRAEAYMGRVLLETSVGRGCWIGISFPLENTRTGMA